MITLSVAELVAQFSKVLAAVRAGERIGILCGRSREPVAMIVPYKPPDLTERAVGFLDGKVRIEFMDDFDMTEEELLSHGKWTCCLTPTPHHGQSDNRTDIRSPFELLSEGAIGLHVIFAGIAF